MAKKQLTLAEIEQQMAELMAAKQDAISRELQPMKDEIAKLWTELQTKAAAVKASDSFFVEPWSIRSKRVDQLIKGWLTENGPAKLDAIVAAFPDTDKAKLEKVLTKRSGGTRPVFTFDAKAKTYTVKT